MSRRVQPLTGDLVDELPAPCNTCLFWELGATCPSLSTGGADGNGGARGASGPAPRTSTGAARQEPRAGVLVTPSEPRVRKQAWVSGQVQDGFPPGRLIRIDGEVAAYALFGPARSFAPRAVTVPAPDDDAILLATVWVEPTWRERGLGRLLVQAAIKDAIHAGAPAVEAYGDRRWRERSCLLPVTWLLHEGFEVHREHPRMPLLRLDARRTVRWVESLEHALEEVLGALPRRLPAPVREGVGTHRTHPEPSRTDRDP